MLMAFAALGFTHVGAASADQASDRDRITVNSSANDGRAAGGALGHFVAANITRPNCEKDHNLSNMDINAQSFFYPLTIHPVTVGKARRSRLTGRSLSCRIT
jgi:hypothetical protein